MFPQISQRTCDTSPYYTYGTPILVLFFITRQIFSQISGRGLDRGTPHRTVSTVTKINSAPGKPPLALSTIIPA